MKSSASHHSPHQNSYYSEQGFTYSLGKLSGKGYSTNQRVFKLTENQLCYYSKTPSGFKNTTNKSSTAIEGKPKARLKLSKITAILPLT